MENNNNELGLDKFGNIIKENIDESNSVIEEMEEINLEDSLDNNFSNIISKYIKILKLFTGTCKVKIPNKLKIFSSILRSIGQVVFCNNPISGILILTGISISNPFVLINGLLSLFITTISVIIILNAKEEFNIDNGLYGFNSFLIGSAIGVFINKNMKNNELIITLLLSILFGFVSIFIQLSLSRILKKIPVFTLPFVLTTFLFLEGSTIWTHINFENNEPSLPTKFNENIVYNWNLLEFIKILLKCISQIFLINNSISGLFIILGIIICSPLLALSILVGSLYSIGLSCLLGIDNIQIEKGLWGFNGALCFEAIISNWKLSLISISTSFISTTISILFQSMLQQILLVFGLPVLTFPFCLTTILMWTSLNFFSHNKRIMISSISDDYNNFEIELDNNL